MVILKKIKGATLMETLVASVLIVIVFMVSSLVLNNLFSSSIRTNTRGIEAHLNELEYLYTSDKLILPHNSSYDDWTILIDTFNDNGQTKIEFEAVGISTKKRISRLINEN